MRRAVVTLVLAATAAAGLAACSTPGGAVDRNVTVEFETSDSAAARPVVVAQCGHLPGVTDSPTASGDPNVILDYTHASTTQYEALIQCLSTLQTSRPDLQIRAVVDNPGTDT